MPKYSRLLLSASFIGAAIAPSFAGDGAGRTLWVRLDPAAVTAKSKVGQQFATTSSIDRKSGTLKLNLKPGISIDDVVAKLAKRREVLEVRAGDGVRFSHRDDLRSVSMLSEWIEKLGGDEERQEKHKKFDPKNEEKEAGTEYLQALKQYIKVRAYPYDRIDSEAYNRGIQQAAQMKAAKIGTSTQTGDVHPLVAGIGGKWKFVGPNNLNTPYRVYYGLRPSSGRVNAIAYDPVNTKTIYIGAPQGGVMKTTDAGVTWTAVGDNWGFNTVSSLAVDPKNPNTVYAGTGDFQGLVGAYTMGVMKSLDGGATWTNVGRSNFGSSSVSGIVVDPDNSAIVTLTTGRGPDGVGRVWRSVNGGTNWTPAINVLASWSSLSYGPADSSGKRSLYAIGSGGNLYRSDNSGAAWTKLTSPVANSTFNLPYIAASAVDSKTAYILSTQDQKIYKSTDSGANWTDTTGSFPGGYNWSQGFYDWYIACYADGGKDHLFTGLIDVVESPDGGSTWQPVGLTYTNGAKTHNDQHSFAVNPKNPKEVLMGNDGGLYMGTGGAGNWTITGLSANLGITQFYNVVWHPTDKTKILGGTQDNASPVSIGNLSKWENVGGGDGGFCAINPTNPNVQYVTIYGFTVIITKDGWATSTDISPDTGSDASPFVTPIFQDPVRTRYLYGCTNYLWRYDLTTNTWASHLGGTQLSNGSLIHVVTVAPSNGDVIYTGSDDGRLFVSTNAGASFRSLNGPTLPNRAITSISVDPANPNDIVVGLSGTGSAHVMECTNTSVATPQFVNKSGVGSSGLPDVPVNVIERDPSKPTKVWYVGNDIGVFSTGDGGQTWGNATVPLGLPNVQVNSLSANARTGLLSAGTYGRGVWQIGFGTSAPLVPSGYSIMTGSFVGGNVQSLAADDGNNLVVSSATVTGLGQVAAEVSTFTVPGTGTLNALSFEVSVASSTQAATEQLYVKNWKTGAYELLKAFPGTTTRTTQTVAVTGTIANYMSSARKIELVTRALVPSSFGTNSFRLSIDRTSSAATTSD
ncbi:sialidase family protein [Fimbriimonas ginsengisoli]|uniref:Glycosyl hydrolase n=1 Tax=Fimbriimonas ginsengisoli Gsoil 348 TaxID=661478 RepID=A0A068NRR9_FIMGI|nr:sialidase family protein [Fimbriimonas ginsengisoli]AIE85460.1 glycosyl hydrolase [Fimbriimonas ginsengisoli Gsoil 348]